MSRVQPGPGIESLMGLGHARRAGGRREFIWALPLLLFVQLMAPSASILPTKVSLKAIEKQIHAWEEADDSSSQAENFWDVYGGEKTWKHAPIPGLTAEHVAVASCGQRMRKFTSLKKMVVWYMGGEKARRRNSDFWKLALRGAEASSEEERGAGRGGGVWIPPPPEEQRGVHEELNERVMGKITFTDDGAGGVQMDTTGMSPMRMSGGGVGNGDGELLRLKGGMKLFTHNILSSPVHGAEVAYPLEIQDAKTEIVPATYDPAMVKSLLPKVEWDALRAALRSIGGHSAAGLASDLPETKSEAMKLCAEDDEATLRALFRVLVEIQVTDGYLACPSSGRRFVVQNGVPNLLSAPIDTSGD